MRRRITLAVALALAVVAAPFAGLYTASAGQQPTTVARAAAAPSPVATFTSNCILYDDRSFTCAGVLPAVPSPTSSPSSSPTATATPTPTATQTTQPPTPTPSATVTPTPTPTPSPTPTTPPADGYPNADNTGVPSGTVLRTTSGRTITQSGAVIDGELVQGCLEIRAANVVIKNSRIECNSAPVAIASLSTGLVVQDSEITCLNSMRTGMWGGNWTAVRLDISRCENGLSMKTWSQVRDSWLHDNACRTGSGAHPDGIQIDDNSVGVQIIHNRIDQPCTARDPDQGGTSAIIGDTGTHTGTRITDNLLTDKGSYTLYCALNPVDYRVERNRIGRAYFGHWVNCDGRPGQTISGNVLL